MIFAGFLTDAASKMAWDAQSDVTRKTYMQPSA